MPSCSKLSKASMKRLLSGLLSLMLAGCGDWMLSGATPVRPWQETHELVALVPNGPTTLYVNAFGTQVGLEHDLLRKFADSHGLKLRLLVTSTRAEALERLRRHEAHVAAGVWRDDAYDLAFGPVYKTVEPVLVYRSQDTATKIEQQLADSKKKLNILPEHVQITDQLQTRWSGLNYVVDTEVDGEALFEKVADAEIDAALVDGRTAAVMQNYYPHVAIKRGISDAMALAWAFDKRDEDLAAAVSTFIKTAVADGVVSRLVERYYGHVDRLQPLDATAFLRKREQVLPDYRKWFHKAEEETGLDWRLVAALGYQESHWNPAAVSPTGVRGLMMLTTDTAQYLGVDRLDASQSILGGARYMRMLIDRIPQHITAPDRIWLALAAYNVGMGHLEDARILAKRLKKNPDSWADLKSVLPLLRKPEYFTSLKNGFARGGEAVVFVESLRSYFDILARFEEPYSPASTSIALLEKRVRGIFSRAAVDSGRSQLHTFPAA